mgnify:CR=1 FL=1
MKNFYKKACPPSLRSGVSGRGITIIELLVVLAVLGIIISVVLPQFSKIRENQVLKSGVQDILSSINKARSQTLASLNSSEYGVSFESSKVVIFTGTSFTDGAVGNEIIDIITPATISNVTLNLVSDISGEIYFNRLSGSPSKTGTVTISTTNYSKIITISATGVASID